MAVKLIDDKCLWDKYIEASQYGTLFHLWDFLKIVEKHSKCKLYPYGVFRGEELICLFPLFVKSFMGSKMIFSPPPGLAIPNLGFVMSSLYDKLKQRRKETYINEAIDEMEAEIKKLDPNFVFVSTVNGFADIRPFKWNGYNVHINYSYVIDLKRPLDEIRANFDNALKHDIAEGEKMPFSIRPAYDAIEFYDLMQDRYKRRGRFTPVISKEYIQDVLTAFPDNVKINYLYNGNEIVDTVAYYQYKKRFAFWIWPAGQNGDAHGSGHIAWDYIRNKKAEGMESLLMPGASEKGQFSFISKFNAPLEYNFYITKNNLMGRIGSGMYSNVIKVRI